MSSVKKLVDLVGQNIPSLSSVVAELQDLIETNDYNIAEVEELISRDPALTMKILKVANSPAYGLSRSIDSVSHALMLLGISEIRDIVISCGMVEAFGHLKVPGFDGEAFWKHSVACGVCARYIANALDPKKAEGYFVSGLVHDIGRLVMAKIFSEPHKKAMELSKEKHISAIEAEKNVMKIDHCSLASLVFKEWKMPNKLRSIVEHHHHPSKASDFKTETMIIHISDAIVESLEIGSSGEPLLDLENTDEINRMLMTDYVKNAIEEVEDLTEHAVGNLLG